VVTAQKLRCRRSHRGEPNQTENRQPVCPPQAIFLPIPCLCIVLPCGQSNRKRKKKQNRPRLRANTLLTAGPRILDRAANQQNKPGPLPLADAGDIEPKRVVFIKFSKRPGKANGRPPKRKTIGCAVQQKKERKIKIKPAPICFLSLSLFRIDNFYGQADCCTGGGPTDDSGRADPLSKSATEGRSTRTKLVCWSRKKKKSGKKLGDQQRSTWCRFGTTRSRRTVLPAICLLAGERALSLRRPRQPRRASIYRLRNPEWEISWARFRGR